MATSNTAGIWTPPAGYENFQDPFNRFDRTQDYSVDSNGVINVPYGGSARPGQNPSPDLVEGNLGRASRAPADPNPIPQVNVFGSGSSMPSQVDPMTAGMNNLANTIEGINDKNSETYRREQTALAGAQMFADVMNAQSRYNSISSRATTNIFRAHMASADARSRAQQRAIQQESSGQQAADEAILAMAAQGQDVGSAGVQRVASSFETVGRFNAMIEEINGVREALGYDLEALDSEGEIEQARIQRNFSFISSGLSAGARVAPLYM